MKKSRPKKVSRKTILLFLVALLLPCTVWAVIENNVFNNVMDYYITKDKVSKEIPHYEIPFRTQTNDQSTTDETVPTIYGSLIYQYGWENMTESDIPYGIYSFPAQNNTSITQIATTTSPITGTLVEDEYLTISRTLTSYGGIESITLRTYNTGSWDITSEVSLLPNWQYLPLIITYDRTDQYIYALGYSDDWSKHVLATLDPSSGELTTVATLGTVGEMPNIFTMSATDKGGIFAICSDGNLYKIDKATGTMTAVGNTGFIPSALQSTVYDYETGTLYWAASFSTGESKLCTVDLTTGAATIISNFDNYEEFVGLFIMENNYNEDAPQQVEAAFNFQSPGSLQGTLSFTAPSKTMSGKEITEDLYITIKVDDTEVKNLKAQPGSNNTETLTLTEGAHLIAIEASNNQDNTTSTYINVYAGIDIPTAVKNIVLEISEQGVAKLTWDNVTEGIHNGYLPTDRLRYRVTRCDGTIAANDLATNSFSEQLQPVIKKYYYSITPYINDKEGETTASNFVTYGDYYEIPYFCDFENHDEILQQYTFINANNDYNTWSCENNWDENGYVLNYYCNWSGSANDYAITPEISFKKETLYKLSFKHTTNNEWNNYTNKVRVLAGLKPEIDALNIAIADFVDINNENETVEAIFTLPDSDKYYIAFQIYSDAAQSTFWINDISIEELGSAMIPAAVSYQMTAINTEPEKIEFECTMPTLTACGTELTSLTSFNIYKGNEETPCHTIQNPVPGKVYTWVDNNPTLGLAYYNVTATNQYGESLDAVQNIFVGGYTTPYIETFDNRTNFEFFTIINNNEDEMTWKYSDGIVRYEYNVSKAADDWLITPNIKLKSDRVYKIAFTGKSTPWSTENLSMSIGNDYNTDNYQLLVDLKDWSVGENETHYAYYTPSANGIYHIGLYAYSKKAQNSIEIDELQVIDAFSVNAPNRVENLEINPDEQGLLKTTISFTAPSTNASGDALESISKIDIFRNDEVDPIHTLSTPKPGDKLTYIDEGATEGFNTYRIIAANDEGYGMDYTMTVFVGYDVPDIVENFTIKSDKDNANTIISWEAPLCGQNGGVINKSTLTYTLYREENYIFNEIATNITELTFVDNFNFTDKQQTFRYAIKANTTEGTSSELQGSVILGKLYTVPFNESFANMQYYTNPWNATQLTGYNCSWGVTDYEYNKGIYPLDGDKGMLKFYKWNNDDEIAKGEIISPKVSLTDAINPYLSFYIYHFANVDAKNIITPYITVDDNEKLPLGEPIKIEASEDGWVKYSYSLKDYTNANFIYITLLGELSEYEAYILIDKFAIDDVLDHNLTIASFTGSELINLEGGCYTVEVMNKGTNIATNYDVMLYCNDIEVATQHGSELLSDSTQIFTFDIEAPTIVDAGKVRKYYAAIAYDADMKNVDNVSDTITATVYAPPYPAIDNLEATTQGDDAVLTWGAPELIYYTPISDGFEDYNLFAIDNIGYWTLTDVDQQRTVSPRYGVTFENCFAPKAWQVIDPQRINLYGTDVAPHTGSKCLFSMQSDGSRIDGTTADVCNDDWLISEEIVGGTELRFWAMQPTSNYGGNEKFEVLYSSTDTAVSSFILIEEVELSNMATWNEYVYTLPEDAKYFAIRHTLSFFGLWLDDITFYPRRTYLDLTVINYNIYKDGEKIGESETTTYTDPDIKPGTYTYAVSSTFDLGESVLSNEVSVKISAAIDKTENNPTRIYSNNGYIVVESDNSVAVTIYQNDGKILYNKSNVENIMIPVNKGIYIVKAGNLISKVSVR